MFQGVDEGVPERVGHACLAVPLHLGEHGRHSEQVVFVAEAADGPHVDEGALGGHLEDVDGLLLHRQDGQDVLIQVQPLVVRQDHLVALEGARVTQAAGVEVNDVEGVILQGGPGVGGHGLAVAIHLVEGGVRLVRQVGGGAHDDAAAVVREEAALSVQVLAVGRDAGDVQQDKEALEEPAADVDGPLVVAVGQNLPLVALQEVLGGLAALVLVDFQRCLVGRESDEVASVGGELSQEARRLLHIDDREVGEDVLVEDPDLVPVGACLARADPPALQAVNDILVLDSSRFDGGNMMIHYHISAWESKKEKSKKQKFTKT